MGKQYKPKAKTGDEYVEATKRLHQYTALVISRMPPELKAYTLDPLYQSSRAILQNVIMANAVYVSNKDPRQMVRALEERDAYLIKALRLFNVLHADLDNLMGCVNLLKAERVRFKNILEQLILENGYLLEGRQETADSVLTINVRGRVTEIEYVAMNGSSRTLRLGLTSRNRDHWLMLCAQARELISRRVTTDRAMIVKSKGANAPTR